MNSIIQSSDNNIKVFWIITERKAQVLSWEQMITCWFSTIIICNQMCFVRHEMCLNLETYGHTYAVIVFCIC